MLKICILCLLPVSLYGANALEIVPSKIDFGTVPQHKTFIQTLTLKNTSTLPVLLNSVDTDCGCSVTKPQSMSIQPNETTTIEVSFSSKEYRGVISRKVSIMTKTGEHHIVPLVANVNPFGAWVLDKQFIAFPMSKRNETSVQSLLLTPTPNNRVTAIWSELPWVKATFQYDKDLAKYSIIITKSKEAPAGMTSGSLIIETTDSNVKNLNIQLTIPVEAEFGVYPNPITMGTARVGQPRTVNFYIEDWSLDTDPEFLYPSGLVTKIRRDGNKLKYTVSYTPDKEGILNTKLYILTPGKEDPKTRLLQEIPVVIRAIAQ